MRYTVDELAALDLEARQEVVRMIGTLGVGHVGGSLSLIEALVHLYYAEMRVRPDQPDWPDRDRLVLSKGHAGPALYTVLAMKGYFSRDLLATLNQPGTTLPSHCDMRRTIGVDMTAGSLGQGLSVAVGMALAVRMDGRASRVYCILGDGELQEGQNWEAFMYASARKLDNLVAMVDDNGLQIDAPTDTINPVNPLDARLAAFGWHVLVINGHDHAAIAEAFRSAANTKGRPTAIILKTVKGKGVSLAEGKLGSHNMPLSMDDAAAALAELQAAHQEACHA